MNRFNAVLGHILGEIGTQSEITRLTGLSQSTVSRHTNGSRPVNPDQLGLYLRICEPPDRARLLSAWLQSELPPDVLAGIIVPDSGRLEDAVARYSPKLSDSARRSLDWLAAEMSRDPELEQAFTVFLGWAGWKGGD